MLYYFISNVIGYSVNMTLVIVTLNTVFFINIGDAKIYIPLMGDRPSGFTKFR